MTLRYGDNIVARPQAHLAGWFERREGAFWPARRWVELNGSLLTYRHTSSSEVLWVVDLRESKVSAGSNPLEIVLLRTGEEKPFSLFARNLDELKLWFREMKRVSDCAHDFYHLSAQFGSGSAGCVYLGRDKRTDEGVAVFVQEKTKLELHKLVLLTRKDKTVLRATQTHSNCVKVIDMFESTSRFYIILELLNGGTLVEALQRSVVTERVAQRVIRDILSALAHLHSRGVVHGAVRPKNILCTARKLPCAVKLSTFGRAVTERDNSRLRAATPVSCTNFAFVAPEELSLNSSGAPGAPSDIFAAGCLLHLVLTGETPFAAHDKSVYLNRVAHGASFRARPWGGISSSAKTLLRAMLRNEGRRRPTAAQCLRSTWLTRREAQTLASDDDVDASAEERLDRPLARTPSDPKTVMAFSESSAQFVRVQRARPLDGARGGLSDGLKRRD